MLGQQQCFYQRARRYEARFPTPLIKLQICAMPFDFDASSLSPGARAFTRVYFLPQQPLPTRSYEPILSIIVQPPLTNARVSSS